jgi:hypothetical protein
MAPEEVEKPIDVKPEEPFAEETATTVPPAVEAQPVEESTAAAPPTPPADPVKQMGDAAGQVGASVDKAMAGVTPENRVIVVAVVSILVGGWLGSILNGQVIKGVAILVAFFVSFVIAFPIAAFTFGLGFFLPLLLHVFVVIDAIIIANRKSKGETFGDWDFFWKPAPTA